MTVTTLPTGLSVEQAKKDAKKLAQKLSIPLSEAQNIIAFKHGRSQWHVLMEQLKKQKQLVAEFTNNTRDKTEITFAKNKSINVILGPPGSGKSVLLLDLVTQFLEKGFPVMYLGAINPNSISTSSPYDGHDLLAISNLLTKYPESFRVHDCDTHKFTTEIDALMLNGAILVIEEPQTFINESNEQDVRQLIDSSMHTFIVIQRIEDGDLLLKGLKNTYEEDISMMLLKGSEKSIQYHTSPQTKAILLDTINSCENKNNEFIEFIQLKPSSEEIAKFRFYLADHKAL